MSAFIAKGHSHEIFLRGTRGEIKLIVSSEILGDFNEVIRRKKFGLGEERIDRVTSLVNRTVEIIETETKLDVVKGDLDDNKIVECAVDGKADYIVSGDAHLKNLGKFENIRIVSPAKIIEILNQLKRVRTSLEEKS